MASSAAPTHMTSAPPSTAVQRRQPAWRSSLKKRNPQRMTGRTLRGRGDGEQRGANAHDERAAEHSSPAAPAGLAQFVEEKESPENDRQDLAWKRRWRAARRQRT